MTPWPVLIATYGLQFALELKQILDAKSEPTVEDFKALIVKYGTETLEQKLLRLSAIKPAWTDQDVQFLGVNYLLQPGSLPPGVVAEAVNARFTTGVAEQRRGMVATNWTQGAGGDYGNIYRPRGAAVFCDPNGVESIVMASDNGKVYVTAPNNTSREVLMPSGETITGDVRFVQCFDTLVMLRGADHAPLALRNFNLGFEVIEQTDNEVTGTDTENPSDGTVAIPNATEATFFNNRLLVLDGRDEVAASDFLNYTRYQPTFSQFRINQGNSGSLVAIHPVDDTTLAVFKSDSIYLVENVTGDLSAMKQTELTRNYGCVAAGSITKVGADIYFLSRRGVCSIAVTAQGHIQGVDVPLSADIQPLIDQIDWTRAHHARGVFAHNRLYLAVPLSTVAPQSEYEVANLSHPTGHLVSGTDNLVVNYAADGTGNNAVLVYDFLTQKWAGVDVAPGLSPKDWLGVSLSGTRRLSYMGNDGFIYIYDDPELCGLADQRRHLNESGAVGFDDYFADYPVAFMVKTRGYGGSSPESKAFMRAGFGASTSNATLTVTATGNDSYNEDTVVSALTRSRTRYLRPFDRAAFDVSNTNGDHGVEGRGDYSIVLGTDGVVLEGTRPDKMQHFNERRLLRMSSNYCQLTFTNASGSCRIDSAFVEFKPTEAFATTKT